MKTTLAAAALAVLVPLHAGAVATKTDPNKWDPATERNAPSQWVSTQIGDDIYIAFFPAAPLWKTAAYAPKAAGAKFSTPLFKVGTVAKGAEDPKKKGSEVWTVATEKSNYRIDFGAKGKPYDVVCVQAGSGCPPTASMPLTLDQDGGGFKGIPTAQSNVVLRVSPPGAAAAGTTAGAVDKTTPAAAQDSADLGVWEKIAYGSIAKPTDEQARDIAKDAAPHKKAREALNSGLANYLTFAKDKKASDPLSTIEIDFLKALLGGDGAAFEARAKWPDPAAADAQKFTTRWRGLIVKQVNDYNSKGEDLRVSYTGATPELNDARREDANSAQTPGTPLEAKLAAFHPGQGSRREGAQRAVVAAWIESQQGDAKFKKIKENLTAGKDPGMSWDAMLAAAMRWVPAQIKDPKAPALANVPRETLLDAYCDPSKTTGAAARASMPSALAQARGVKTDATAAAGGGSVEETGTGGRVSDGAGTAAVDPLQGECSKRLDAVRKMVPDNAVGPVGGLTLKTEPPAPGGGTGGSTGDKFNKTDGTNLGDNKAPGDTGPTDKNFADHMRAGATAGLFLGLLGMMGGPVGLLVFGAVGFGLGYGIDKLTNSKVE